VSEENLSLFSSSDLDRKGRRAPEESLTAPPGTAEKLAMPLPKDDGVPARRRLQTLVGQQGYRVEATNKLQVGKRTVSVPVQVSMFCMDTRTYWQRVDAINEPNPMMELVRSVPEVPAPGSQWTDATSSEPAR
jgi:hypothetical protein